MSKELLVVFDIDETLIHFISKHYTHLFTDLPEDIQDKFKYIRSGDSIILLRPYLEELFNFYKSNPNIKVGLWTYSEQEYAYSIRDILSEYLDLDEDFFLFAYGAEDMIIEETGEEDDYPKNLTKIYENFPQFNTFNTFIVDDAPGNIKHEINMKNSLLIQPFAPFSVDKVRKDLGEDGIEIALNDTILTEVMNISEKVITDIMGCSIEDIEECFHNESVFSKNRVKRMGLSKLLKKYVKPPIYEMVTIGKPKTKENFVMVAGKKKKKKYIKTKSKKGGKQGSKYGKKLIKKLSKKSKKGGKTKKKKNR